jgi:hypothetical protein
MIIPVRIKTTAERVIVEFPRQNLFLDKPNLIIYSTKFQALLATGIDKNEFEAKIEHPEEDKFAKSFQREDEQGAVFDTAVVKYYVAFLYSGINKTGVNITDWFDYELLIPEYEKWSESRKLLFEYSLQSEQRARRLTINGKSIEIAIWKRYLEISLRSFFTVILPYIIFFIGIMKFEATILNFLLTVFLVIGFGFAGVFLWFLTTKKLISKSYSRYIFSTLGKYPFWKAADKILLGSIEEADYK